MALSVIGLTICPSRAPWRISRRVHRRSSIDDVCRHGLFASHRVGAGSGLEIGRLAGTPAGFRQVPVTAAAMLSASAAKAGAARLASSAAKLIFLP
jgi:hypothetical protein